ncbi:hypothetical protein [Streptomyces sp. NPDC046976]|uniref:hypothetical protein n=1 Tax=Streptomyces sp. NPDC046976 TaxID=3155258 RepID=UPI0033E18B53
MAVEELIEISSPALAPRMVDYDKVPSRLHPLLDVKNGFYAFESALFVRPWGGGVGSAEWWNAEDGWRTAYGESANGLTFFAEDVFGFQFAVDDERFYMFDPETAELDPVAASSGEWADCILEEFDELTGYSVAHLWQSLNGPLRCGFRLTPAVPFFLGGEFKAEALKEKRDLDVARMRAHVYTQTKDLPDGSQVKITLI